MSFRWICPYCNFAQAVTDDYYWSNFDHIDIARNARGDMGVRSQAIVCANPDCNELTLSIEVGEDKLFPTQNGQRRKLIQGKVSISRSLIPEGRAKPQPDYIPAAIREDYAEACLIADLSPKSSATLARRCLQGMLRDFCGVKPRRLVDEIDELAKSLEAGTAPRGVSDDSVGALTAVRHMGNFGAHMEKEVDLVVPVEANEAGELIALIETLLEDWYVERHKRAERFSRVTSMAAAKRQLASDLKSRKSGQESGNTDAESAEKEIE